MIVIFIACISNSIVKERVKQDFIIEHSKEKINRYLD
jgi:hypothetical protein